MKIPRWTLAAATLAMLFAPRHAVSAQGVTTGAVSGVVTSAGSPVNSATVIAVHVASGTRYSTFTHPDGHFFIPNMRVGGPYTVSAQRIGLQRREQTDITVTLGQATEVNFDLEPTATTLAGVTITATQAAIMSPDRTGAATTITRNTIESLANVSGRLDNIVRLTPESGGGLSFAGQDSRMNNITVDGSYFNNSFGLGNTPGDRTGVAPISLDAIEQVQVNVAPFDVRQGNFVGANVNTVTRSGTNEFHGSLRYQTRNQSMVGTRAGANHYDPGTNKYHNGGGWISGPILKNRIFFFGDYEDDALNTPATSFVANTGGQTVTGNTTRVLASDLDQLSTFLQSKFGYATGPYQGYNSATPSTRYLGKLDFNLSDNHKLSVRYNSLDSYTDVLESNSSSLGFGNRRTNLNGLNFANSNYQIVENIRSTVAELNSTLFGGRASNNFIAGYTHQDESRKTRVGSVSDPSTWFPLVDILNTGSVYTSFGFEPFTPNNELRYNTSQLQDNFVLYRNKHTITFGVSAEKYHSENVFYPGSQSVYVYNSLADFYTDANAFLSDPACQQDALSAACVNRASPVTLNRFQIRYMNVPGLSKPIQPLNVFYGGIYAQDAWTPSANVQVMAGLRVDAPWWGNTAYDNPQADALSFRDQNGSTVHYNSGAMPKTNPLFSPRLGFNWDVHGDRSLQLRGGMGIFTGKPAYVWISNQIGNTGILTGFDQYTNTKARPFNPNPKAYANCASATDCVTKLPPAGKPASSYELDVTSNDFKFPQTWRTDLAVDKSLPWDFIGTAEVLYNKDVNGISYINANLPAAQAKFAGVDQRARWTANRINSNITSAIVLGNENRGYQWTSSASVRRLFENGFFGQLAYSYTVAKNTIDPGSIASGSWTNNQIAADPNNPPVAYSAFSPGYRLFLATSLRRNFLHIGASTFSLFSEIHSGFNFSYTFSGDANGDGAFNNDLLYIPRDTSEMNFKAYTQKVGSQTFNYTVDQQKQAWEAYIRQDPYLREHRGEYAARNAAFAPSVFRTDFSFTQELARSVMGHEHGFDLRIDILNVGNLLNHNWGIGKSTVSTQPLVISGSAADAQGQLVYQLRNVNGVLMNHTFDSSAGLSDVYRFQISMRYHF